MKQQSNITLTATILIMASLMISATAHAVVFTDAGASLQKILNDITVAPASKNSSIDVNTDQIKLDSQWRVAGSGGSYSQIIIELSGNAGINTLGIYDVTNPLNMVTLYAGVESAGAQKLLTFANDGSVLINFADTGVDFAGNAFGYFLNTGTHIFYSDTDLNADAVDHMVAYQGQGVDVIDLPATLPGAWVGNEYIMAWEDQFGGGDANYSDLVLIIESVYPMPEPSMLALLGIGIVGFIGSRSKKRI
ncbi:PEP-CTERM protein-sorting domain-containing protein [Nitrosomonas aestuarii]|uniref:PEP-CTERM protein-sorting domain-containing protein n=1 Tax=Nitrosomonas aestuarii TaxID=52441 RepID=A0A1I4D107_9PROT|nr:DUF4114 domain-containing protein [Nitrosomonas aestuarii]SFK86137.1 PEP-CTERM protein-sorting domain-containing protein [Nitrosomonas aestuarii]